MRTFILRKRTVALTTALAVVIAAVAVAYLASTGSGTGAGATSASAANMALTSTAGSLTHIGDSDTITVAAANDTASPQALAQVTISVAPKSSDCPAGSFTVGSAGNDSVTVSSGTQVPANGSADVASTAVHFNNVSSPQNACLSGYDITLSGGNS